MAEVLSPPPRPDSQDYYGSPLKRSSTSYSSFLSTSPSYMSNRPSPPTPPTQHSERQSRSVPSSNTASFTDLSQLPSLSSTPASSVSFGGKDDDDDIMFPSYDEGVKFYQIDEPLDLPPSPKSEQEEKRQDEGSDVSSVTGSTQSEGLGPTSAVADDTDVKQQPSRHVDYLSHNWREEDIWSSWRHIVSQRKVYGQRSRLENASWRTWAKSKYHLSTVSPEALNWLKESDVTWLYGPLQPAATHPVTHSHDSSPRVPGSAPFTSKKPILKKRSMSEVMLQRSISANSLIKQAAASVIAQQPSTRTKSRPNAVRAASDFVSSNSASNPISRDQVDYFMSRSSSSAGETPCDNPKRHIRFDDKVEQCIAIECADAAINSDSDSDSSPNNSDSDSDSSDGVVMMRRPRRRKLVSATKGNRKRSSTPSGRIIEKLPDTTLKYRVESPEIPHPPPTPFGRSWSSSKLGSSASSETLRPSNPSRNFLMPEDDSDDEGDVDPESSWAPSSAAAAASSSSSAAPSTFGGGNRRDSVAVAKARSEGLMPSRGLLLADDDDDEHDQAGEAEGSGLSGLRRTPSGMFMPHDEDDDEDNAIAAELGLLGKVNETINTAKDIAHVIWNVGWRK